jgi:hypothetical protein
MRRFESDYRINEGDDVLNKENFVHQDVDLRLDAVEQDAEAFRAGNRADIEAILKSLEQTFGTLAAEMRALLDQASGGLSADIIVETTARYFLTDARRAAILSDLRGDVDASGDTMAKLLALIVAVVGGAPAGRQSLKAINDAVLANTATLNAITSGADPTLDSFAEALTRFVIDEGQISGLMTMVGNRLRGDAAGNYSDAQVAQFLANLRLGFTPVGQCRLIYSSATQLLLMPYQGNQLWVNGAYRKIPSAGVALANTGLAAATLYYVYAFMSGSTLTLEAVTTTHAVDATYGHEIKSGDGTRSLVGMIYMAGASGTGTFAESATQRFVANWFNRRDVSLYANGSGFQTGSTTAILLTGLTVQFLTWASEPFVGTVEGYVTNATANAVSNTIPAIDGATFGTQQLYQTYAANSFGGVGFAFTQSGAEGLHTVTAGIWVNSGTGTWALTNTTRVRL